MFPAIGNIHKDDTIKHLLNSVKFYVHSMINLHNNPK